jgi:hypothetical protein
MSTNRFEIKQTLKKSIKLQPSVTFTIENEMQGANNSLDLTVHRKGTSLYFSIYVKPTQTDIIIHNSSCHSYEHKRLPFMRCLLNELVAYPVTTSERARETEMNTVWKILQNNEYRTILIKTKTNTHSDPQHQKSKWVNFTYCGKEMRKITRIFKHKNKYSFSTTEHNAY